jgi:hypothetical protein
LAKGEGFKHNFILHTSVYKEHNGCHLYSLLALFEVEDCVEVGNNGVIRLFISNELFEILGNLIFCNPKLTGEMCKPCPRTVVANSARFFPFPSGRGSGGRL